MNVLFIFTAVAGLEWEVLWQVWSGRRSGRSGSGVAGLGLAKGVCLPRSPQELKPAFSSETPAV